MTKDKMLASLDFAIRQLDTLSGIQNKDLEWVLMRANAAIQHVLDELGNADVSSDEPKTNFEKWKDSLSAIEVLDMMGRCHRCPARNNCGHKASDCATSFIKWAKEVSR